MSTASPQDVPLGLLALPEGDGSAPFLLASFDGSEALVVAGRVGATLGIADAELGQVDRETARRIAERARTDHRMATVPPHVLLHILERAIRSSGRMPEEWERVRDSLDPGLVNTAVLVDPLARQDGALDPEKLDRSTPLAHPKHGVFFELPHAVAEPIFGRIMDILQGPGSPDERRLAIGELVAAAATEALSDDVREAWILGMDVVTILSAQEDRLDLRDAARHTALALRAGAAGADIPWVRVWTERQLAHAVEQLMAMNRRSGPAGQG